MYWREFRVNWRQFTSSLVGITSGFMLSQYLLTLFAPSLVAEFGWSEADLALAGSMPLVALVTAPLGGRLVDRFGVRRLATVGFAAVILTFVAFAMMNGPIVQFYGVYLLLFAFSPLTSSALFCRVIAERFDRARGAALSLTLCGPPLGGALLAPPLGHLIETSGWRAGALALAGVTVIGGALCLMLLGRRPDTPRAPKEELRLGPGEFLQILSNRSVILLLSGMFLVNIPTVVAALQLKLIILSRGVENATATWMVSLYATGVMVGRLLGGFALDRIDARYVAFIALIVPAAGYAIFASPVAAQGALAVGVVTLGFAQGAEGDLGSYVISRRFGMKNFGLLVGLLTSVTALSAAIGSVMLSSLLRATGSYATFLLLAAILTAVGAVLFALGCGGPRAPRDTAEARVLNAVPKEAG